MGFEPTTSSLARRHSTAELLPLWYGAEAQNRTGDTRIFSPLLYRLSYLGASNILLYIKLAVKKFRVLGMVGFEFKTISGSRETIFTIYNNALLYYD